MSKLELKPFVEKSGDKYIAGATTYEDGLAVAIEKFGEYKSKNGAWYQANYGAVLFASNHNKSCNCGKKMVVGSY